MADFLYVCDGANPACEKTNCRWAGAGECAHTRDESHARYDEPRVLADVKGDGSVFVERVRAEDGQEA